MAQELDEVRTICEQLNEQGAIVEGKRLASALSKCKFLEINGFNEKVQDFRTEYLEMNDTFIIRVLTTTGAVYSFSAEEYFVENFRDDISETPRDIICAVFANATNCDWNDPTAYKIIAPIAVDTNEIAQAFEVLGITYTELETVS